ALPLPFSALWFFSAPLRLCVRLLFPLPEPLATPEGECVGWRGRWPMPSERAALVAAIREAPEDDAPRLVRLCGDSLNAGWPSRRQARGGVGGAGPCTSPWGAVACRRYPGSGGCEAHGRRQALVADLTAPEGRALRPERTPGQALGAEWALDRDASPAGSGRN